MATSITGLQNAANLTVFRKVEIRRRQVGNSQYEPTWQDVTSLTTHFPVIDFSLDDLKPFKYTRGQAQVVFRNDDRQMGSEAFATSKFNGYLTRYKTLCRISTGLQDDAGVQYPSTAAVFYGLFADDIQDTQIETLVTVNDIAQSLVEFPASNIAPSVVGTALTSGQIIGTIRDYQDGSGNVVLANFISSGAWILSNTGRTYTIATSTDLQGLSALDLIEQLALAENHVFYIDGSGNANFSDRSFGASSQYTFSGQGERDVNIISLDSYNEGIAKIYNKFSLVITGGAFASTQVAFSAGDGSSVDKYGQREYSFQNKYVSVGVAGSICSDLLSYHSTKKAEVQITTKYITQLNLQDRVTLIYRGTLNGDGSMWGSFLWGHGLWSSYTGGVNINGPFGITGIQIDMEKFQTIFRLREV